MKSAMASTSMFRAFTLTFLLFGASSSKPQTGYRDAYIVKYDNNNIGTGGYSFDVETSDGFRRTETGQLVNEGREDESLAVRGSYTYVGLDGNTYQVDYVADENGFQPIGRHLPSGLQPNSLTQLKQFGGLVG